MNSFSSFDQQKSP